MESLGMIETYGLVPLIVAADAMTKAARVVVMRREAVDAGIVSVYCRGSIAACRAAVDAGVVAAGAVGKVVTHSVIPQPHPNLLEIFNVTVK